MPILCYIGWILLHVLPNFSSTSKAYQPSAAASHNSNISSCLHVLDWETSYIWPIFALSLVPMATSQLKVALDVTQYSFSISTGMAKTKVTISNPLFCITQRHVRCTGNWSMRMCGPCLVRADILTSSACTTPSWHPS
jgi:hypothetical protein